MGHARRLEDKIRLLCAKAAEAHEHDNFCEIMSELQAALHEHAQRVRKVAVSVLAPPTGSQRDRRQITK
jgi:hypothetical protein